MKTIDVAELKSFIKADLPHIHTAGQIASHANCSTTTVDREFRANCGVSVRRYLTNLRISRMKNLLENPDNLCKVVCLEVGLRVDAGTRLFKRETGMTLEEFRSREVKAHD